MKITEEYRELMQYNELPERFRAGDFGITEQEEAILKEFVDNFYDSVNRNGYVDLEDFTEFMAFLDLLRHANTDAIENILAESSIKSAEIWNRLREG